MGRIELQWGGVRLLNRVILKGVLKDIEPSHQVGDIKFSKAKLLVKRPSGQEDVINLKFKSLSLKNKENDDVIITGNLRSYSYRVDEDHNKVLIYVFTYFDQASDEDSDVSNKVTLSGRICKLNELRSTRNGKDNIHFIVANNIVTVDGSKRLNSYIPCIAWGRVAKDIENLSVSDKINIKGELHSREHKKLHDNGDLEIRVAHELLVTDFEVVE